MIIMETELNIIEEIPEKYIKWIENISIWDPKEMRNFLAENLQNLLERFASDLLFLAKNAKDTLSKEVLTTKAVLGIIKEIDIYLPPL
jgi:hypothetical protein